LQALAQPSQTSATVYIATTVRKGRWLLTVRGKAYCLVVLCQGSNVAIAVADRPASASALRDPDPGIVRRVVEGFEGEDPGPLRR